MTSLAFGVSAAAALAVATWNTLAHVHVDEVVMSVYALGALQGVALAVVVPVLLKLLPSSASEAIHGAATPTSSFAPATPRSLLRGIVTPDDNAAVAVSTAKPCVTTEFTLEEYETMRKQQKSAPPPSSKRTPPPSASRSTRSRSGKTPKRYGEWA